MGGPFDGAPLFLLHHKGARSKIDRVTPLMYQKVDGGYAIFASTAGADDNPDWFHNIKAHPATRAEIGSKTIDVTARIASGNEHDEIWEQQKKDFPQFAGYEEKTLRYKIPVIVLVPQNEIAG